MCAYNLPQLIGMLPRVVSAVLLCQQSHTRHLCWAQGLQRYTHPL